MQAFQLAFHVVGLPEGKRAFAGSKGQVGHEKNRLEVAGRDSLAENGARGRTSPSFAMIPCKDT